MRGAISVRPQGSLIPLGDDVDGPSSEDDAAWRSFRAALLRADSQSERPKSIVSIRKIAHFVPGTEASYPFDTVEKTASRGFKGPWSADWRWNISAV